MLKRCLAVFILSTFGAYKANADSCSSFFPNSIQGNSASSFIQFKDDAQVINDADNILTFPSIDDQTSGGHNTCNTTDCSVTGGSTPALTLPSFTTTGSGTDILIESGSSTIGSGGDFNTNEANKLEIKNSGGATFLSSTTDYVFSEAIFENEANVTFNSGVYWFGSLEIKNDAEITVNGPVTIYVNEHFDIQNQAMVNAGGSAADLVIVGYQQIHLKNDVQVNAVLYGAGNDVRLENNAQLEGAISASGKVELKDNSKVTFTDISTVQIADLCDSQSANVDHYEIIHDSSGQTCADESINIRACENADCSSLVNVPVSLDFQADGGTKTTVNFTGNVVFSFAHSSAEILTLSVANPSLAPDNNLQCDDGSSGTSCDIAFTDSGCSGGGSCSIYFPQTVQAHSSTATLKFKDTGNITSNSTTQFPFVNLTDETAGGHNTCVSTDCSLSGSEATALTLPTFVTSTSSTDINLTSGISVIGTGGDFDTNEINDLTVTANAIVSFVASPSDYVISNAVFTANAQVTFNEGVYWFDFLEILANSQIFINGKVTIYVNQHFDIEDNSLVNIGGDADDLVFVGYEQIHLKNFVQVKAVLYGAGQDVHIQDDAQLTGAISANGTLEIKDTAQVIYADVSNIEVGDLCGGGAISVDHYEIVHDGTGQTCTTESVTVKACANSDCSSLTSGAVSVDFQTDGITKNSATFTGSTVIGFDHGIEETLTLGIANASAAATNPLICDDSSTTSCDIVFSTNGCVFANCADTFVDGITNSDAAGTILFENLSTLTGNPDTVLASASVTNSGFSTSCISADCSAGGVGTIVPKLNASFQSHTTSNNLTVNAQTHNINVNDYQNITVRNGATLNMSAAFNTYTFAKLKVESLSTVNMTAGDYYINDFEVKGISRVNVTGGGTVRIYSRIKAKFKELSVINGGITGDSSQFVLYYFGDADKVKIESTASVAGYIYSAGNVEIKGILSGVFGAVSAEGEIKIKDIGFVVYRDTNLNNTDFGQLCPSCSLASFNINQPQYSLACPETRASILVSARCNDLSIYEDYEGTVNLTAPTGGVFYNSATAGSVISNTSFSSGDAGEKTVYLYFPNQNNSVKVTATDTAVSVASTASIGTDFRASGFRVSTQPSNFSCGNNTNMTLQAFGQTDAGGGGSCEVLTGFAGEKLLDVWFVADLDNDALQDSATATLSINDDNLIDQSSAAENNVSLSFVAGEASFNLAYNNTAKLLSVNFEHDDTPYAGDPFSSLVTSTNSFVVAPAQWAISALNGVTPLTATSANATPVIGAGNSFNLSISAQCSDATTASDYRPNSSAGTVVAYAQRTGPSTGSNEGVLKIADATSLVTSTSATPAWVSTNIPPSSFNDGGYLYNSASYDEVGLLRFFLKDQNYYGVDSDFSSLDIGRFTPDHFSVTSNAGSFLDACNNSFTYTGQNFTYNVAPSLEITAQNQAGGTTKNYTEAGYQKLLASGINRVFASQDNSQNGSDDSTKMNISSSAVIGALSVSAPGVLNYDFGADQFTYIKDSNAVITPFASDYVISINDISEPGGADGVSATGLPSSLTPTAVLIRYGRFRIENVFGPETHALALFSQAEYFNNNGFEINDLDVCTSVNSLVSINSSIAGTGFDDITVGAGASDFSLANPLNSGDGGFSFTAPGSGNQGSIELSVDISTLPWLFFDWDGDGDLEQHDDVTATFGLYRGHDKIIYWREVLN